MGPMPSVGRFRYVGPLSLQLVTSGTWDLCRFSWSLPLRGTLSPQFVASVGRLRYGILIALVASVGRLRSGILVASAVEP